MRDVTGEGNRLNGEPRAAVVAASSAVPVGSFTDEADLARALAGLDPHAWRQLFDEQYQRVYNYAYLRTGNPADADDIASSVFVEAVRGIKRFSYQGTPIAAWLFRIAHNETVDLLKRRTKHAATSIDTADESSQPVARDTLESTDEWRDVREGIGALKPDYRDVLMLRLVEGRSVFEVASLLGKSEGAVKITQMRALQALRTRLGR
jgi:RNA polymerase sigma-70 factor (ECF subfamily)